MQHKSCITKPARSHKWLCFICHAALLLFLFLLHFPNNNHSISTFRDPFERTNKTKHSKIINVGTHNVRVHFSWRQQHVKTTTRYCADQKLTGRVHNRFSAGIVTHWETTKPANSYLNTNIDLSLSLVLFTHHEHSQCSRKEKRLRFACRSR